MSTDSIAYKSLFKLAVLQQPYEFSQTQGLLQDLLREARDKDVLKDAEFNDFIFELIDKHLPLERSKAALEVHEYCDKGDLKTRALETAFAAIEHLPDDMRYEPALEVYNRSHVDSDLATRAIETIFVAIENLPVESRPNAGLRIYDLVWSGSDRETRVIKTIFAAIENLPVESRLKAALEIYHQARVDSNLAIGLKQNYPLLPERGTSLTIQDFRSITAALTP